MELKDETRCKGCPKFYSDYQSHWAICDALERALPVHNPDPNSSGYDTLRPDWCPLKSKMVVVADQLKIQAQKRPSNYQKLSAEDQWMVDKHLGILDWDGK